MPKGIAHACRRRGVSLEGQFDLDGYLTPTATSSRLMVLEHQAHFSNLVTRAAWETRLGEPMRIAEAADALADYMLFVDEAKILAAASRDRPAMPRNSLPGARRMRKADRSASSI